MAERTAKKSTKGAVILACLASFLVIGPANHADASGKATCVSTIIHTVQPWIYAAWGRCTGGSGYHYYETVYCDTNQFFDGPKYRAGSTAWSKVACPDWRKPIQAYIVQTIP
jgi:hypothetical protein